MSKMPSELNIKLMKVGRQEIDNTRHQELISYLPDSVRMYVVVHGMYFVYGFRANMTVLQVEGSSRCIRLQSY
jgi:hypothetical protein